MAFLNEGEITQVLAETLQPDTAYRLTVWIGNRPGPNSPNYSVELWAGETELAGSENQNIPIKGRLAPVTLNYACDDPARQSGDRDAESFRRRTTVAREHGGKFRRG
jgi:hypothetical protein